MILEFTPVSFRELERDLEANGYSNVLNTYDGRGDENRRQIKLCRLVTTANGRLTRESTSCSKKELSKVSRPRNAARSVTLLSSALYL